MTTRPLALLTAAGLLAGCVAADQARQNAGIGAAGADDVVLKLPADYKAAGPYMISDRLGQDDQAIVLFANAAARDGARADGKLPYGSVLIGEIYGVETDAAGNVVQSKVGRRVPAELKAIVMMERQEGADDKYPEAMKVGDWEFEVFSPEGENLGKDTTACRECHHPLTDTEFTFSYQHLAAAN